MGWVGLGQSADESGWIGSHEMDPWTTLLYLAHSNRSRDVESWTLSFKPRRATTVTHTHANVQKSERKRTDGHDQLHYIPQTTRPVTTGWLKSMATEP